MIDEKKVAELRNVILCDVHETTWLEVLDTLSALWKVARADGLGPTASLREYGKEAYINGRMSERLECQRSLDEERAEALEQAAKRMDKKEKECAASDHKNFCPCGSADEIRALKYKK